jgi:anti-anti-sigma factor
MSIFRINEREIGPGLREIRVEGELDLAVANQLVEAIARSQDEETLIDLEGCDFIDSTGIAVIVRAHRERAGRGGRVVVHSPSRPVLRVLAVTGLTANGLVFDSRDEALAKPMAEHRL